jgi:hypothetical protein
MKISNYHFEGSTNDSLIEKQFFASIDVTTGFLWWKKTSRRSVSRTFAGYYFFIDDGTPTPRFVVEKLEKAYFARKELEKVLQK